MGLLRRAKQVGVIEMNGMIGRGVRPDVHLPLLERARDSKRIGALVLAINSPGGAASASEEIYLGVARVAEVKPVVAYIRDMGASGAFYIASGARKIVALRNALVGSIGVIFSRPILDRLIDRVGIGLSVQKTGPHKDMYGPWRSPTDDEVDKMNALMGDVFERFVEVVAKGRNLSEEAVREIATGELFTAKMAQGVGLIDDLGDLETAKELAADLAGMKPGPKLAYLRPRRRFSPIVRAGFGREVVSAFLDEMEERSLGRLSY